MKHPTESHLAKHAGMMKVKIEKQLEIQRKLEFTKSYSSIKRH